MSWSVLHKCRFDRHCELTAAQTAQSHGAVAVIARADEFHSNEPFLFDKMVTIPTLVISEEQHDELVERGAGTEVELSWGRFARPWATKVYFDVGLPCFIF